MQDCGDVHVLVGDMVGVSALSGSLQAVTECGAGVIREAARLNVEAWKCDDEDQKLRYRAEVRQKRVEKKRAQKRRQNEARQAILGAMTEEDRKVFLQQEREAASTRKSELQGSLLQAFESGAPKVVVDCSYSAYMDRKELTSVAMQSHLCYTAVRDLQSQIQLHFTSLNASCASLPSLEAVGLRGWTVHVHEASVWELFDKECLVVLSPDAEVELDDVRENLVYVIGGFVDRAVDKNRSAFQARENGAGMRLRKLPLRRFGPIGAHPVLNIDTVVRILASWVQNGGDWRAAFEECLPHRHSGKPTQRTVRKQRADERKAERVGGNAASEEGSWSSDLERTGINADAENDARSLPEAKLEQTVDV